MAVNISKGEGGPPEREGRTEIPAAPEAAGRLGALRDEIDRLFDSFVMTPFGRRMVDLDPFRRIGGAVASLGDVTPRVDVRERENDFVISAELPGVSEEDVAVTVSEGVLSIKGEKKAEKEEREGGVSIRERSYGAFHRAFRLPETVDEDKIEARFDNGVLTLVVPKAATAPREKRIQVKKGG